MRIFGAGTSRGAVRLGQIRLCMTVDASLLASLPKYDARAHHRWRSVVVRPANEPEILRRFSVAERLELATEISDGAYALNWRVRDPWPAPEELTGEGVEWARRRANELAEKDGRNGQLHVFLTLVRAKSPLDPRWYRLAPLQLAWLEKQPGAVRECVDAVGRDHRTEMITPWLTSELPNRWCAYFATVARLHPDPALVDKLFANYKSIMEWPKADERARLDALGRTIPALAPAISKNLAGAKMAKLTFTRVKAGVKQLTPLQKKQLAPLEKEYGTAGGVHNAVAFYEVRDDKGAHKYDAIVLGGMEGIVFGAGTTKVAVFAQGGVEAKSVSLSIGLEHALAAIR